MKKEEVLYATTEEIKSVLIFPKKDRKKISEIESETEKLYARALVSAEKTAKKMLTAANRRLCKLMDVMMDNVVNGYHLKDEIFIPEYLGFKPFIVDDKNNIRTTIYSKDGYNMIRIDDKDWLISNSNSKYKTKVVITVSNMYEAVIILKGIGMEYEMKKVLDGVYQNERSYDEIVSDVMHDVIKQREEIKNG